MSALVERGARPFQVGAALAVAISTSYAFIVNDFRPADAYTYLAAGERLNAGHRLYAIVEGDRLLAPDWVTSGPLFYPPLIAAVWRPLAAAGEWTVLAWWGVAVLATLGSVLWIVARRPIAGSLLVTALSLGIGFLALLANVTSFILAGTAVAWGLGRRNAWAAACGILTVLAVLKPVGLPLVVWALSKRDGWRGFLVGGGIAVGIGLLGAGPEAHIEWLSVAFREAGNMSTALSPARLAPWLPIVVLLSGCAAAALLPTRAGFVAAVVASTIGTPAVTLATLSLLSAVALAWPQARSEPGAAADRSDAPVAPKCNALGKPEPTDGSKSAPDVSR